MCVRNMHAKLKKMRMRMFIENKDSKSRNVSVSFEVSLEDMQIQYDFRSAVKCWKIQ